MSKPRTDGLRDWRTRPDFIGECETCGAGFFARNALAVAAIHSRRYEHEVRVEMAIAFYFGSQPNTAR